MDTNVSHLGIKGVVTCWASCYIPLGGGCGASEAAPVHQRAENARYSEVVCRTFTDSKYDRYIAAVVVLPRA